eukprot:SAG25_NODE_7_length_29214_cov_40.245818_12_plen_220_part_00
MAVIDRALSPVCAVRHSACSRLIRNISKIQSQLKNDMSRTKRFRQSAVNPGHQGSLDPCPLPVTVSRNRKRGLARPRFLISQFAWIQDPGPAGLSVGFTAWAATSYTMLPCAAAAAAAVGAAGCWAAAWGLGGDTLLEWRPLDGARWYGQGPCQGRIRVQPTQDGVTHGAACEGAARAQGAEAAGEEAKGRRREQRRGGRRRRGRGSPRCDGRRGSAAL